MINRVLFRFVFLLVMALFGAGISAILKRIRESGTKQNRTEQNGIDQDGISPANQSRINQTGIDKYESDQAGINGHIQGKLEPDNPFELIIFGLSAVIVLFLGIVVLVMVNDESFQSDDLSSKILLLGGAFLMAAFFIGFSVFVAKRRDLFVGIYYLYDAQGIEFHQRKREVYRRNWDYFKRFEIQGNGTVFRLYDQDRKLVINGTTRWTGSRDFMAFAAQRMKETQALFYPGNDRA